MANKSFNPVKSHFCADWDSEFSLGRPRVLYPLLLLLVPLHCIHIRRCYSKYTHYVVIMQQLIWGSASRASQDPNNPNKLEAAVPEFRGQFLLRLQKTTTSGHLIRLWSCLSRTLFLNRSLMFFDKMLHARNIYRNTDVFLVCPATHTHTHKYCWAEVAR